MLKISDLSDNCYKSELDLFSVAPTQTAIEEGIWDTIQPPTGFDKNPVIEFKIPGNSANYIDLSQTEIYVKCRITNSKDRSTTPTSTMITSNNKPIFPINNFLHSLFENINVRFNNTLVEQSNNMYPYRAYLEDLLNYDSESKSTFLTQQCFFKDSNSNFNSLTYNNGESEYYALLNLPETDYYNAQQTFNYSNDQKVDDTTKANARKIKNFLFKNNNFNDGAIKRHKYMKDGKLLKGKLHLDVCNLNRYLLNNVDVTFQFTKSKNEFCLMVDPTTTDIINIDFINIYLKVRRVKISPTIMLNHAMALEKANAKYPIKKVLINTLSLNYKSLNQSVKIHTGIMPNRVVCGIIPTEAYTGSYKSNPFCFENYEIREISLKISSKLFPYSSSLEPNGNLDNYIEAYNSIFTGIREDPNDITYEDFKNGYFILAYNLSPDLCSEEHYSLLKDGSLELDFKFGKEPVVPLNLICYMEFDNIIEITKSRTIIFDHRIV